MSDVQTAIATEAVIAGLTQEIETLRDLLQVTQIEKCRLLAQVDALKARLIDFEKNGKPD
jgi:hypothetical protein